jgi:hypothetical protein
MLLLTPISAINDKDSLWNELNIKKTDLFVKQKGLQDMQEDFRSVFQMKITKCYLASWLKSVIQRFQEGSV